MRKLLTVRLKDTSLNIAFPILIKFAKPQESPKSTNNPVSRGGGGKDKIMSLLANFTDNKKSN